MSTNFTGVSEAKIIRYIAKHDCYHTTIMHNESEMCEKYFEIMDFASIINCIITV